MNVYIHIYKFQDMIFRTCRQATTKERDRNNGFLSDCFGVIYVVLWCKTEKAINVD